MTNLDSCRYKRKEMPAKAPPRKKPRNGVFFGFVFVLLIIYIVGYTYRSLNRPQVSQMRVEMGSILQPTAFTGIIVRDETVYRASGAGALVFHVENHERVRRGRIVATVQDAAAVEAHRASLNQIDQDALKAHSQRSGLALNEEEINRRNRSIANHVNYAAFDLSAGNLEGVFALGDRVRQGLESRNDLHFSGESFVAELTSARMQIFGGFDHAIQEMAVSQAGILSVVVDGFEGLVGRENLTNIPRNLINQRGGIMGAAALGDVAAGDEVFRIVRSNDWFIVAYLPRAYVENASLSTGADRNLYVQTEGGLLTLNVRVANLIDHGGEFYVVFQTNRELMRFIDVRYISFQLTENPREGFKIPWNAIVERGRFPVPEDFVFLQNGVHVVNLQIGENTRIEPVLGTRSNDGMTFYILSDASVLRVGDVIISGEETFRLETIETVTGVFVTNMGTTQFRFISLKDNFAQNSDYVILNPAQNGNIRLFDRIVADAANVFDRQILH